MGLRQATGVLEIEGSPSGAIYLDQGAIAFARAAWAPGLVARLRGVLPPTTELLGLLASWDQADPGIGALLVRYRYISPEALRALLGSIIVEAFMVLAVPLPGESRISDIRFVSTGAQWTDTFPRLPVDAVRTEAARRAESIVRYGLAPTAPVALRDIGRPSAILTREQWAIVCRIGDTRSASDLAQECGLALSDVITQLGDLITTGLCAPVPGPASVGIGARLPVRVSGPVRTRVTPTPELLRQVLNGIRRLS